MSIVGVFSLSGDHFKLKCPACHQSEMTITYSKDSKIRLSVPCTICPRPHTFVLSENSFYDKDVFALACQYTGLDICFIGKEDAVRAALEKSGEDAGREFLKRQELKVFRHLEEKKQRMRVFRAKMIFRRLTL